MKILTFTFLFSMFMTNSILAAEQKDLRKVNGCYFEDKFYSLGSKLCLNSETRPEDGHSPGHEVSICQLQKEKDFTGDQIHYVWQEIDVQCLNKIK